MCNGLPKAPSPHKSAESVISANGIKDSCLGGIKSRSTDRYTQGEDYCFAMRSEISSATVRELSAKSSKNSLDNKITKSWKKVGAGGSCPTDPNDAAYLDLLEGIGCNKKRVYASAQGKSSELKIDDSMVLTNNQYWTRTTNWRASVRCPNGQVAVGMCSSGKNQDCYGQAKEILCAARAEKSLVNNNVYQDIRKDFTREMAYCSNGYVVTEFCSPGENRDCSGTNLVMRCKPLNTGFSIDYAHCERKESTVWDSRLQATSPNMVMVGMCTSGKYPDCGPDKNITKSAAFCPLVPTASLASGGDKTHPIFRFYDYNGIHLMSANLGENPANYFLEPVDFNLYDEGGTNRQALYRCVSGLDRFASPDSNCEGTRSEGMLGYMSTTTGTPIYRCYGGGQHLITTNRAECTNNGFTVETTLGYAP
jgi:hypothetical protein